MEKGYKKARKVFTYLIIMFTVAYWVYTPVDDWISVKKFWTESWLEFLDEWIASFAIYLLIGSLYYWTLATIVILIYYKIVLPHKVNQDQK